MEPILAASLLKDYVMHVVKVGLHLTVLSWVSVIQERMEFEDDSRIGNQSNARNSFHKAYTIPEINVTIVHRGKVDQVHPGADQDSKFCYVRRTQ